jgi:hypothetical protein
MRRCTLALALGWTAGGLIGIAWLARWYVK